MQDIAFTEYSFLLEDEQEMRYKYDNYIQDCVSSSMNTLLASLLRDSSHDISAHRKIDNSSVLPRLFLDYVQHPLSFLANIHETDKEKQHYKFATQQTISGIADCIQVYYSYTLEPKRYLKHQKCHRKCVALHFRFVNVTSFEILAVRARFCLTEALKACPHLLSIQSLPPKQSKIWTVATSLQQFTDGQGFIQARLCRARIGRWRHRAGRPRRSGARWPSPYL